MFYIPSLAIYIPRLAIFIPRLAIFIPRLAIFIPRLAIFIISRYYFLFVGANLKDFTHTPIYFESVTVTCE